MDILKTAQQWAKDELFSTPFFVLFGIVFMIASLAFWQLGKTDLARAYIIPTLVVGLLLTIIGTGLFFTNKSRIAQFEKAYNEDATAFVDSELERAEATVKEYKNIVFTAIPIIIAVCALGLTFFDKSIVRASLVSTIAMMAVILLIDGTAQARMKAYHEELIEAKNQEND